MMQTLACHYWQPDRGAGAICPHRGVGAAIITPAANAEMMNLHLAEIGTQVAPGAYAVLLIPVVPVSDSGGIPKSRLI